MKDDDSQLMWENFITAGVQPFSPVTEEAPDEPDTAEGEQTVEEQGAPGALAQAIVADPSIVNELEKLPEVQNWMSQRQQSAQPAPQAQPQAAAPQAAAQQAPGHPAIDNKNLGSQAA